jgi:MinD-like ATPase involved in chromosome partitioning or flagellar assembly
MRSGKFDAEQAAGIRAVVRPDPVQVVAVTGGKGGVGKTSVAVNLSAALAAQGKRVLLFDGDMGLANVDVLLGLTPRHTLEHVLDGRCTLEEAVIETPLGFRILPGASGVARLAGLSTAEHLGLVQAFSHLTAGIDVLVVDTAAGIADSVRQFCQAAQQVLVVLRDEPASLTDAYALIKLLNRNHGVRRFRILANMSPAPGAGEGLFRKRRQGRVFFDRDHGFGEAGDDGGGVAKPAPEIEHHLVRLDVEHIEHLRQRPRLEQDAAGGDRQVLAHIGCLALVARYVDFAGDGKHRLDDGEFRHVRGADLRIQHRRAPRSEIRHL